MPDILRQIQQCQPDIIIGFQINYTCGAMTDRFNGVNIIRGLHGGIICAIGKTPQLNAIHTEFRLKQNGIEIGKIAYGRYIHAAQLFCRPGTDIQQIGHGQRPYLFPVVVLIDNGHRIGFLHVTAQLGMATIRSMRSAMIFGSYSAIPSTWQHTSLSVDSGMELEAQYHNHFHRFFTPHACWLDSVQLVGRHAQLVESLVFHICL